MSRRLLRLEIPVFPERRTFRLHDPAADPDAPDAPTVPADSMISASREQLLVLCAQEHLGVHLTVEEWEDAPPPFSDGYEDEAKCVLYLRGHLRVADMGKSGHALSGVRLAGGVGDYGVRVYTRNRTEAVRRYTALYSSDADPLGDEFQQAAKHLEGLEQYLVQLWRES